ncbi:GNAT family N-acetyltransferase [Saccharopolyspora rosea]|uniref:GNAT family N-acetyltransferase n=1 Tax=Saccharopolyspora rosea TaxID=524884 RepID=A0ABW3FNL0_9PSEU|nr:GNAT family N-acetyltransferase [Saccharopolyspora rosea]
MTADRIRQARESDHPAIVDAIGRWWTDSRSPEQARELALLVPRLFLQHFAGTSFVVDGDTGLAGFLVGFLSHDRPDVAYIHFAGVDPRRRRSGLARRLYEAFFDIAARAGRNRVHCVTSPANTGSIRFHRAMGFEFVAGDGEVGGIPVHSNYDGAGHTRVCLSRRLPAR